MKTIHRVLAGGLVATTSLVMAGGVSAQASPTDAGMTSDSQLNAQQGTQSGTSTMTGASSSTSTTYTATSRTGTSTTDENRNSFMSYTRNGYIGAGLGKSDYDTGCGSTGSCKNPDLAGKIYAGGMFNPYWGLEFEYIHMGRAERGGGHTRAHGLNLSFVGRVPLGDVFAVFGKAGATYGRTETTADAGSGISTGDENGFGPSFGVGVSVDFTRNLTGMLEWERHRFEFAGGRDWVDAATIGVKYRF